MGEFAVEHAGQRLRVALVDGEGDGIAEQRRAAHAVAAGEALFHHLAEFADDGTVAFGDGEFAFQRVGTDGDRVRPGKQAFETTPWFPGPSLP